MRTTRPLLGIRQEAWKSPVRGQRTGSRRRLSDSMNCMPTRPGAALSQDHVKLLALAARTRCWGQRGCENRHPPDVRHQRTRLSNGAPAFSSRSTLARQRCSGRTHNCHRRQQSAQAASHHPHLCKMKQNCQIAVSSESRAICFASWRVLTALQTHFDAQAQPHAANGHLS